TTVVILSIGVIMLIPLTPILQSDILAPAFNWVISALFGALGYKYFKGNLKLIIAPIVFVTILAIVAPTFLIANMMIVILLSAIVAIVVSKILFNKKLI
ncbi:MAG: hypothetical protein KAH13_05020, partial [Tenericutes bacterium]|nr:hypothetical protein [Mycoplasmatota bacterium]